MLCADAYKIIERALKRDDIEKLALNALLNAVVKAQQQSITREIDDDSQLAQAVRELEHDLSHD